MKIYNCVHILILGRIELVSNFVARLQHNLLPDFNWPGLAHPKRFCEC